MTKDEELKKFHKTAYYQSVVYPKLEDIIIDKRFRPTRACLHLGEKWAEVRRFLSTQQKENLEVLNKKYGRNGRKLRRVFTSPPRCS